MSIKTFQCRSSMTRRTAISTLAFASAALVSPSILAQAKYPDHPVRVILPFGAGGVADVTARMVAEALGNKLGQNFVIENMPGAGGITAARAALQGGTDGYTLMLMTNGNSISAALFEHLPYDPTKDFKPISTIGTFTADFVVNESSPYQTMGDFLKAAKEKPGTLNLGTINVGSTQNLTAELFKSMAGIDVQLVPFKGSPDVVIGLLRNDIQMGVDFYAALKPTLDSGKVRALGTSAPARSPELPNVPTVQEAGVKGFDVTAWNGFYAPAGTPDAIVQILNKALQEVLSDPGLKKKALEFGIDTKASTPAELDAHLRGDIEKWSKVIASAHIPKQ
jgi:tripartite-type tricarboxylate transporter receptor subunit TctC